MRIKTMDRKSGDINIYLLPNMTNRHGLVADATGTSKIVTMKVLAESFSDLGVSIFLADVKGDVSSICQPREDSPNIRERIARFGLEGFEYTTYPTHFKDIFGETSHSVLVTVSDMDPCAFVQAFRTHRRTGKVTIQGAACSALFLHSVFENS